MPPCLTQGSISGMSDCDETAKQSIATNLTTGISIPVCCTGTPDCPLSAHSDVRDTGGLYTALQRFPIMLAAVRYGIADP